VQIQIAQFACGAHPAASGSFTILEMANPDLSGVVYMEQLTSAVYLDRRIDVDHYQVVMGRLVAQLPPPEHTAEILASIRDQF
jgi:hypothetical protein